ncbi:MAG: hypothetical protein COT43_06475 [Candidatus Marinimicrobia bacterium CG08_land_8_20_14_0_20_45_22]|nr:MAG: hypothetical protein COT43_06475 [Candidatus Marinimicrobia bacterium CG08_land_8_20_14_0_20_45_22]
MAKLTIKLIQHSPIIHFQHEQGGATLRATEIKHYLTQYIKDIDKYYKEGFGKEIDRQISPGNGIYRISIEPSTIIERIIPKRLVGKDVSEYKYEGFGEFKDNPVTTHDQIMQHSQYFGDIKEMLTYQDPVVVTFFSFDLNILTKVYYALPFIFALENFGTRANKGFGSFFIREQPVIDWDNSKINGKIDLNINSVLTGTHKDFYFFKTNSNRSEPYKSIFYFYNALKGGINEDLNKKNPQPNKYLKSLLWKYFNQTKTPSKIWEKRLIKKHLYDDIDKDPLNGNYKFLRVLLGFTPEYTFHKKPHIRMDKAYHYVDSKGKDREDEGFFDINNDTIFYVKNPKIERSVSPITFKPIKINGGYKVFIILKPEYYTEKLDNQEFDIRNEKFNIQDHKDDKKVTWKVTMPTIPDFDLSGFIKWAFSEINKDTSNYFIRDIKVMEMDGKEV